MTVTRELMILAMVSIVGKVWNSLQCLLLHINIDSFIDGEITDVQCQHCLSATNLGKQFVFVSQNALDNITLLERCFLTDSEKELYLNTRQESFKMNMDKVKLARKQYRNQGEYIEDILK